jgi:hypothetical protein
MVRTIDERRAVLEAFDRALSREVYNLSRWPGILWQQLHNRLQGEESAEGLIDSEHRLRSASGCQPWIRPVGSW